VGEKGVFLKAIVPQISIYNIVLETKVKDRRESHGL